MKKITLSISLSSVVFLGLALAANFTYAEHIIPSERIIPYRPPSIGSVVVTGGIGWQNGIRIANLEKMGTKDWVYFQVRDGSGRPFPIGANSFYILVDGRPLFLQPRITFDVRAANGQVFTNYGYVVSNLNKSIFGIPVENIRVQPSGNYLVNPLIPGPVYLANVSIEWMGAEEGVALDHRNSSPNLKLFTVSDPPRLNAVDKSSIKFGETVTLDGANFDVFGSEVSTVKIIKSGLNPTDPMFYVTRGANSLMIDMDPSGNIDMEIGNFTRAINARGAGGMAEDILHYCGSGRVKFEMPSNKSIGPKVPPVGLWKWGPMPTGTHNIRLINDFGVSNAITINVAGGQGEAEPDDSCNQTSGVIDAIFPTSGPVGSWVEINGKGLGIAQRTSGYFPWNLIRFNEVEAPEQRLVSYTKYLYGTKIKVKVPEGATTGPLTLLPGAGGGTLRGPVFTVTDGAVSTGTTGTTGTGTPAPTATSGKEIGGGVAVNDVFPSRWNIGSDNAILISGLGFTSPRLSSNNQAVTFSNVEVNEEGTAIRATARVNQTNPGVVQITVTDVGGRSGTTTGGTGTTGGTTTGTTTGGDGTTGGTTGTTGGGVQEGAMCPTLDSCSKTYKDTQGRDLICRNVDGGGFQYMTTATFDSLVGDGRTHFYGCGTGLAVSGYCKGTSASGCVAASSGSIVSGGIGCNASEQSEYGIGIPPVNGGDPGSFQCNKVDGSWGWKTQKNIRDVCRSSGCHTIENTRQSLPDGSYCAVSVCSDDPSGLETVGGCLKTSRNKPVECRTSGSSLNKLGAVQVVAAGTEESFSLDVYLANRSADAPYITNVSVGDIDYKFEADMTLSGQNLENPSSVQVAGINAAVESFHSVDSDRVEVKLIFSEFFTGKEAQKRWALFKEALAATTVSGVTQVCTGSGCDSIGVNASRLASVTSQENISSGSEVGRTPFSWGIDNPFKADVDNVMDLLAVLAKFIFQLGIPVAVIVIIYSGVLFLISADRSAMVTKATNGLKYAAIGLAVLLIGKGFVSLIQSLLSVK